MADNHGTRLRLDALIGRCMYDKAFVEQFRADPHATLQANGLLVDPRRMEKLVSDNPEAFDMIANAMTNVLGDDFWARAGAAASTCDPVGNGAE